MPDTHGVTDQVLSSWLNRSLVWLPEHGIGTYPVEQPDEAVYDDGYWEKYEQYAATPLGRALNAARLKLVNRWPMGETLVDVGIGCGQFVRSLRAQPAPLAFGFDVSPRAIEWLQRRAWWLDPYKTAVDAATFWDSLEHIREPGEILARVRRFVFVSIPIFRDQQHVLASKHFRRDEHRWYFTRDGLIAWMDGHGFSCVEHNTAESILGREDIHSFVFCRYVSDEDVR